VEDLYSTITYATGSSEEEQFFKSLEEEDNTFFNGREVFRFDKYTRLSARVFIDKETYGIVHLEYTNVISRSWRRNGALKVVFVKVQTPTIDFKFYEGKLFLNY